MQIYWNARQAKQQILTKRVFGGAFGLMVRSNKEFQEATLTSGKLYTPL